MIRNKHIIRCCILGLLVLTLQITTVKAQKYHSDNGKRMFAYYSKSIPTIGITKMNISNLRDGDVAGLAIFQNPYAYIAVKQWKGSQYVAMVNDGKTIDSAAIKANTIYLKASADYGTSIASFSYSLDNNHFIPLGNKLLMRFSLSIFTGNKVCLFNYATQTLGGYVDFDWFRMYPGRKVNETNLVENKL